MDARYQRVAEWASEHHMVVSTTDFDRFGVGKSLRHEWVLSGRLARLGTRAFTLPGTAATWQRALAAGLADLDGSGYVGGRASSQLHHLDGFVGESVEFITVRGLRHRRSSVRVRSTERPFLPGDLVTVDGLRATSAERTILDAGLFGFSQRELENAIDSAIRMRLTTVERLRRRLCVEVPAGSRGIGLLRDALVDAGGESALERRFLRIIRKAGIVRPVTQRIFRDGSHTVARVDALFPNGIVVEVDGHGTHATRRQRQHDAQRRTELTARGLTVVTFTYEDVFERPGWVLRQLVTALRAAA